MQLNKFQVSQKELMYFGNVKNQTFDFLKVRRLTHHAPHKKPNNFCYRAFYFVEILDLRTHTRRELYSCRIANRLNEQ